MRTRLAIVDSNPARPRTRGDCDRIQRPCPWLGCRHHLAIDVSPTGSITIVGGKTLPRDPSDAALEKFVDDALDRVARVGSCSLDLVADEPDGVTLEIVGKILDVSRERIRQVQTRTLRPLPARLRRALGKASLDEPDEIRRAARNLEPSTETTSR